MKAMIGNSNTISYLEAAIEGDSLCHAYLFTGPLSVGKTMAAFEMARKLLCAAGGKEGCDCASCIKVSKASHPDLHFIEGKGSGIDEIRDLVHELDLAPYQSNYRIGIISHAQNLTIPALNSFLKTLEEPGQNTILILTAENPKTLLPTIVSRTRRVNFGTISDKEIFEHLNKEVGVKREIAENITSLVSGRIGQAITMAAEMGDAANDIKEGENFLRIYRSDSIADKISLAGKMTTDKEALSQKLNNFTSILRKNLLSVSHAGNKQDSATIISALDGIAKAEKMIAGNINAKLVVESLLLRSL